MHKQKDRWMDKLAYNHTHAHTYTHTKKRHGRAVAHFIRVRMRCSVSQPSMPQ